MTGWQAHSPAAASSPAKQGSFEFHVTAARLHNSHLLSRIQHPRRTLFPNLVHPHRLRLCILAHHVKQELARGVRLERPLAGVRARDLVPGIEEGRDGVGHGAG